jgi:hypothetical protein
MEKNISYINRTYADYKEALIAMSEKYYPELSKSFNDASIASWQIDMVADIADNLSYHIDRVYQETNIDSAQEKGSLYAMARNAGVKIPGPKGAMAEVKLTITLSVSTEDEIERYAPIIKRGTRFAASSQEFELLEDVDFASQFDENGISNRTIIPNLVGGIIAGYTISKLSVVSAGETRVYRHVVNMEDVQPFMEVLLPINNIMNIESIINVKDTKASISPNYGTFYGSGCSQSVRFYEVDSLSQNWLWTEKLNNDGRPITHKYEYNKSEVYSITKGEWRKIDHKFITEYTDRGYLKIIFGASNGSDNLVANSSFSKWQMNSILNNPNLGILPEPNSTLFILYRVGGGKSSNVAKGAINKISYLNATPRGGEEGEKILKTLKVTNTTPSTSGKDMPNVNEMRYLIKYHNAAQQRCVTVKDYIDRILMLPPKYGTPFRVGVAEENNKIMVYLLGINHQGKLDSSLPLTLIKNIEDYLTGYRMINDYVEIKSGRIINLGFDVDAIIDKNYNKIDVIRAIINTITDYMDINKRIMGEEIYIGDLEKEISKIDGLINLISLKVINKKGGEYSPTEVSQETINGENGEVIVDLDATDGILYNDGDTMMEILKPESDITIKIKER